MKKSANIIFLLGVILITIDTIFLIFITRKQGYRIDQSILFYFFLILIIAMALLIVAWVIRQNEGYYWPNYDYRSAIMDDPVQGGGSVYVSDAGYYPGLGWLL